MSADSPRPVATLFPAHVNTHTRTDAKAVKSRIKRFPGKEEGRPGAAAEVLSDAPIFFSHKIFFHLLSVGRRRDTSSKVSEIRVWMKRHINGKASWP